MPEEIGNIDYSLSKEQLTKKRRMNKMALSRKLLESMGLDADKVSTIIEAHTETVNGLKSEMESYKESAGKLEALEKELATIREENKSYKAGDWQSKYEKMSAEYESYKAEQTAKETTTAKRDAYRKLLKEAGISEKRMDAILRVADLDALEIKDGAVKDSAKVIESIKTEWSDFVTTTSTQGANTQTPPKTEPAKKFSYDEISKMSRDEINANWGAISSSLNN